MEHGKQNTASKPTGWHILSADRVTVVPIRPGMTVGESPSGELSFDRAHAQIELDIDNEAVLLVRALGNHQLGTEDKPPTDCLTFRRSVDVSLSQNTLMLNTEFVSFTPSKRPLRLKVIYPPVDVVVTESPTAAIEPVTPREPASDDAATDADSEGVASGALPESTRTGPVTSHPSAPVDRTRKGLAALAGVAVSLVLLVMVFYPTTQEQPIGGEEIEIQTADGTLSESAPADQVQLRDDNTNPRQSSVATQRERADSRSDPEANDLTIFAEETQPVTDATAEDIQPAVDAPVLASPSQAVETNREAVQQAAAQWDAAQKEAAQQKVAEAAEKEAAEKEAALQQAAEKAAALRAAAQQEAAQIEAAQNEAARIEAAQQEAARKQAELERVAQQQAAQAAAAKARAVERDLVAADVALEEGRLLVPQDSSALALYSRVLSQNPESSDALRGMAKVQEQLINRAFAQLAAGDWARVPVTLDAAEQAGASAEFVADLRSEANYQLRLAQARSGQFDALYPAEQLVVIEQNMPPLSRWRRGGQGPVEVEFTVTLRGEVRDVQIVGNPPTRLANTIRRAVQTWRFEPALENGRPMPVRTRVIIEMGS